MSSFITNYDELTPILNIYNDVWKTQVESHDEEGMHHLHPN